jgi:hypothetical protein
VNESVVRLGVLQGTVMLMVENAGIIPTGNWSSRNLKK